MKPDMHFFLLPFGHSKITVPSFIAKANLPICNNACLLIVFIIKLEFIIGDLVMDSGFGMFSAHAGFQEKRITLHVTTHVY